MNQHAVAYQVLSSIEGFGLITTRKLLEIAGSVDCLLHEVEHFNEFSPSTRKKLIETRDNQALWEQAKRQLDDASNQGIEIITLEDDDYPPLLRHCADAPLVLFYKGVREALSSSHILSIVGTRNATSYGRFAVAKLIEGLQQKIPDLVIVSGLAFGIDIAAHRTAIDLGLNTIAVMAYGHDHIYPREHKKEALDIVAHGGMLSEYLPSTPVERHRFVARNRIVAGMTAATLVVESAMKGGALITAAMALDYNKEVFALPGRITDRYSQGCNNLIAQGNARAIISSDDIIDALGWDTKKGKLVQQTLSSDIELPDDPILRIIADHEAILFNDLLLKSDLQASQLSSHLFDLELEGFIETLPGGRYTLAFR